MITRVVLAALWAALFAAMTALGIEVPDTVKEQLPKLTADAWGAIVQLVSLLSVWYAAYKQGKKAANKELPWLGKN